MTPEEHAHQRDMVRLSLLLADTPEDRHNSYARVKPGAVAVVAHVFVVPVVTENGRLL